MPKDKVTIDDLAIMVAKGFSRIDKRFEGIDKRFEGIDKRFEGFNGKFISMDARMAQLEESLQAFRQETASNFNRVFNEIDDIKLRLDRIEKRTKEDDDALNSEIFDLRKRVTFLESAFTKLQKAKK